LPLAALFRQVQRLSKNLGEQVPSYGTVFSIVRDLGADLVTLAHEGTKAMLSGRPITLRSTFC